MKRSEVLTYAAEFLALVLLLNVCSAVWSFTRPPAAAATATPGFVGPTTLPTVTPTATPSPSLGPDALSVTHVGRIPAEARIVVIGDPGDERVLVLDPLGRSVAQAAHFVDAGVSATDRQIESSALADGSLVVMLSEWDANNNRLITFAPATGEVRGVPIPASHGPRLAADGRTLAVARSRDPAQRGIWVVDIQTGTSSRIVDDSADRTSSRPVGWSRDGVLAYVRDAFSDAPRVAIVDPKTKESRELGPGRDARWRGTDLLVWSERRDAGVTVYDTTTGAAHAAFDVPAGTIVSLVEPRPGGSDAAVLENLTDARRHVVLRGTAAPATPLLDDADLLIAMWWSSDAQHLYAWTTFNGTETVSDLIAGGTVLRFCRHLAVQPPCP